MHKLVSCPGCGVSGELPDGAPVGGLVCPRCGARFARPATPAPEIPRPASPFQILAGDGFPFSDAVEGLGVWVGAALAQTPAPAGTLSAAAVVTTPTPGTPQQPPIELTAENAAAHLCWLREEVERFNSFVAQQLAHIQRGREDVARAAARTEATFVAREQELNRRQAAALAQAEALIRQQEEDLARQRGELAKQRGELERRLAEVERMEAAVRRRVQEAEQIEEELRADLEAQERALELRRRAVEEAARLPTAVAPHSRAHSPRPEGSVDTLGLSRRE